MRLTLTAQAPGAQPLLAVDLRISNGSTGARSFDAGSFYLVATRGGVPSGTTVAPQVPVGLPALGKGTLPAGGVRDGWAAFPLPSRRSATYLLIWTDDDRLLSPATLATVSITRT